MKTKTLAILALLVCIFMAADPAFAHHGTAEFDNTKSATIKGTVTDFFWTNPHGSVDLDVQDAKGNVEKWEGFLSSPNFLARAGWTKNTLKPGDEVTLTGCPAKRRANFLRVTKIQLANGQELYVGGVEN
jgi:hypothetical protein